MFRSGHFVDSGEVLFQDVRYLFDFTVEVADKDRTSEHNAADGLRDFRFAATRDRAGLMAERWVGTGRDKTPSRPPGLFLKADFRSPGQDVCFARPQLQLVRLSVLRLPFHGSFANTELGVLRNVEDISKPAVSCVAFRPHLHAIRKPVHGFGEFYLFGEHSTAGVKLLPEYVCRKGHRTSRMFFLGEAVEIRREADLCFDFLLAVSVIVVGDDCDDYAAGIPAHQLERAAVIVAFAGVAPAHTLEPLALGRLAVMSQTEILLFHVQYMWGQDDATCVACPVHHVECGVIFGKVWVAAVAEDAFDKIEIAD